jgi:hypothetical protein
MKQIQLFSGPSLLRGLGELVIIIVGVLIALWADQWGADLQDKRTESIYLAALRDDVDVTLISLDENLKSISELRDAASNVLSNDGNGNAMNATLFGLALFEIAFFDHRLSTYHDLKNTGRLALITDRKVRGALAEVERMLEAVVAAQGDLIGLHHAVIDPFLARQQQFSHIAAAGYSATDTGILRKAGFPSASDIIAPEGLFEPAELLSNPDLRGMLALRIVLLSELMESNLALTKGLEDLRAVIDVGHPQ